MAKRDVEIAVRSTYDGAGVKQAETALQRYAANQRATANYRGLIENQRATAATTKALATELRNAGLAASGEQVKGFRASAAAARDASAQYEKARLALARSRGAAAQSGGSFAAFEGGIAARAQSEASAAAALRATSASRSLGDAILRVGEYQQRVARFAAFDRFASGVNTAEVATLRLAQNLDKVAAAQARVTTATVPATTALRNQTAGGTANKIVDAYSSKQGRGPLGLRPYELQNLSYQINDLVTQIAGGTPVMQAFAQQGGQIFQIFQSQAVALIRFIPLVGLATAALSPFISALITVGNKSASLKEFDLLLTRSGERASYTADELARLATRLDEYGGSLKQARAALTTFVTASVDPAYLERFGKTAIDTAKVLKIDVKDAAELVTTAFTGNADAILNLDDKLNFLTDAERKHIVKLRESKKDAEARAYAFDVFSKRYGETAEKMRGPWSSILDNFGKSWQAFVNHVNFIDFSKVKAEINGLMGLLVRLSELLPGVRTATSRATASRIGELDKEIAEQERLAAQNTALGNQAFALLNRQQATRLRGEKTGLQVTLATQQFRDGTSPIMQKPLPADTTRDPPPATNTSKPTKSAAEREAERLAKAQKEFNEDLDAANLKRQQEIGLLDETKRQAEVLTAVEAARAKAADAGLTFTEAQATAIRNSVGALFDAKAEQEGLNKVSQIALEQAIARGEEESRAAYIQRNLALENLTLLTAAGAARADQIGYAWDEAAAARDRAASEKSINDLLATQSELQQQMTFARENGNGSTYEALRLELDQVNAKLLLALNTSLAFWQSSSTPDAAGMILKYQGLIAQTQALGQKSIVTGAQINNMIAGGAVSAVDKFTQSLAEGANVFGSLRDAFLSFAADFLKQIAQMIMQQAILNAIGGGTGGGSGGAGGGIAAFISGLFRHNGGLVGSGGGFRQINPAAMLGAVQYHTGGLAGQKPDEVSAILKRNEEVLTEDDPRHRNNLGKGSPGAGTTVVNVFDPADFLDRALASDAGQRILFNHVSNNSSAFKAALG